MKNNLTLGISDAVTFAKFLHIRSFFISLASNSDSLVCDGEV